MINRDNSTRIKQKSKTGRSVWQLNLKLLNQSKVEKKQEDVTINRYEIESVGSLMAVGRQKDMQMKQVEKSETHHIVIRQEQQ